MLPDVGRLSRRELMQSKTTPLDTSRLTHPPGQMAPPAPADPAPPAPSVRAEPLTMDEIAALKNDIVAALYTCFDPEIPVNIYELGLIYDIEIAATGAVAIKMTLTSPMCPAAGSLPGDVQRKIQELAKTTTVDVQVVWDPPWDKERMSEAAKLQLGIDD
jgi:FeS assembly SUF system protein